MAVRPFLARAWGPVLALLLLATAAAAAAPGAASGASPASSPARAVVPAAGFFGAPLSLFEYLFSGTLGAAVGFLAKWLLEQWSARAAARRKFAESVTERIAKLADDHYWALENMAGVLAGQYEGYVWSRAHHLTLLWGDRRHLRDRLDEIAREAAQSSFPHFCRLIWLFDAFHFQGSTTYLLTDQLAGDMCKRLYNTFLGCLPDALDLAKVRELTDEVDEGDKKVAKKLRDLPSGWLTRDQIQARLADEYRVYSEWLQRDPAGVSIAARALRAYSELLHQELAILYRDWFGRRATTPESYAVEQAAGAWPDLITRQTADALEMASFQSSLLRPLGAAASYRPEAQPMREPTPGPPPGPPRSPQSGDANAAAPGPGAGQPA